MDGEGVKRWPMGKSMTDAEWERDEEGLKAGVVYTHYTYTHRPNLAMYIQSTGGTGGSYSDAAAAPSSVAGAAPSSVAAAEGCATSQAMGEATTKKRKRKVTYELRDAFHNRGVKRWRPGQTAADVEWGSDDSDLVPGLLYTDVTSESDNDDTGDLDQEEEAQARDLGTEEKAQACTWDEEEETQGW